MKRVVPEEQLSVDRAILLSIMWYYIVRSRVKSPDEKSGIPFLRMIVALS